jgi:hypothetical protein
MAKVVLVVNGKESEVGEFDTLVDVRVTGSTGSAAYRLDPLQDNLLRIVVEGEPNVARPDNLVLPELKAAVKK